MRHAGARGGGRDGARHRLAGARVRRVGLDHHGAAGGQRGRGVAARDRERQGKLLAPNTATGPRGTRRSRTSVPEGPESIQAPRALPLLTRLGEEAQLPAGAPPFTGQPGRRESGLPGREFQ